MKKHLISSPAFVAACLFLCAAAVCARLFATPDVVSFPAALDWGFVNWAHRFPLLLELFASSFYAGNLYPRWLPELMAGNGYPTFMFYQPGSFYLALPFMFLTGNPVLATKLMLLCALLLGGAGAYRLARLWLGAGFALLAALSYMLTPYLLLNLYVRTAFSEYVAMQFCPWVLWAAFALRGCWLARAPLRRAGAWFTLSLAAVVYSHPFVTLHLALLLALLVPALCFRAPRPLALLAVYALCGVCALALSSPYWLTAAEYKQHIKYSGIFFVFPGWFRPWPDLLTSHMGSLLAAAAGLALQRKNPISWALAACWLWFLYINSTHTLSWWRDVPAISITQLPYRAFSVEASVRLLGLIFLLHALSALAPARRRAGAALIVAAFAAGFLLKPIAQPETRETISFLRLNQRLTNESFAEYAAAAAKRYNDESLSYDFLPLSVSPEALKTETPGQRPLFQSSPPGALEITPQPGNTPHALHVLVKKPQPEPAQLTLRQFYMPGWHITLNGQPLPPEQLSTADNGRIGVMLRTPGTHDIRAHYAGPENWLLRNLLIALTCGLCLLAVRRLSTYP